MRDICFAICKLLCSEVALVIMWQLSKHERINKTDKMTKEQQFLILQLSAVFPADQSPAHCSIICSFSPALSFETSSPGASCLNNNKLINSTSRSETWWCKSQSDSWVSDSAQSILISELRLATHGMIVTITDTQQVKYFSLLSLVQNEF